MALFVHIAAQKDSRTIRRVGLKAAAINDVIPYGVYAMPIVPNFYISHQWVRELKRRGQRQMCGIYFRIADAEDVWVGHYHQPHTRMTSVAAMALVMHGDDVQGYEIIIPHAIPVQAIVKIRAVPHIGWRYFPSAHNHRPCGCPACTRGAIKSQQLRKAYEAQ